MGFTLITRLCDTRNTINIHLIIVGKKKPIHDVLQDIVFCTRKICRLFHLKIKLDIVIVYGNINACYVLRTCTFYAHILLCLRWRRKDNEWRANVSPYDYFIINSLIEY